MNIAKNFKRVEECELTVLDAGADTGYWSDMVHSCLSKQYFDLNMNVLGISPKVLSDFHKRNPHITVVQEDLKKIIRF